MSKSYYALNHVPLSLSALTQYTPPPQLQVGIECTQVSTCMA